MDIEIAALFEKAPEALELYGALERKILAEFGDVRIKPAKTQVGFFSRYGFAYIWPPTRRVKGWPRIYAGVSFGLAYRLEHPRIVQAVEPYPNRWTHHVLVCAEDEIDKELMGWLRESYDFSNSKR